MKLRVVIALALVAPFFFADRAAFAQMSDNEKKAAARAAYTEGVELQDKGKYAEALADFEKAEKLFDAPTHLLHMAECQAQLGKLVEASETYETLTRKTLDPGAPDAFKQAQTQGGKELETLRPRIPTLRVNVKPEVSTLSNLQINLNDKAMPVEMIGIARPINPGAYKITATATGFGTKAATDIDIKEKDTKTVDLALEKGATGGGTPTTGTTGVEKPVDMTGPTPFGLLIGARPLAFIPFGKVDGNTNFKDYAGAGAGIGVDLAGRVAQRFLVGGSAEVALMRGPDRFVPADPTVLGGGAGVKANVSALSEYIGVFGGFMYDVDKVTPIAMLHGGYRFIQRKVDLTPAVGPGKGVSFSDDVNGIQVGLHAGVSIPLGPMRVAPLLDVSAGQIGERACKSASELGLGTTGTAQCTNADSGIFVMVGLSVGVYYHLDFGRGKSGGMAGLTRPTF